MFCTKCGKEYVEGQKYCMQCGNKLDDILIGQSRQKTQQLVQPTQQPPKKKSPLIFVFIGLIALLIICAIVAGVLLPGSSDTSKKEEERTEESEGRDNSGDEWKDTQTEVAVTEQEDPDTETGAEREPATEEQAAAQEVYSVDESEWKAAYYEFVTTNSDMQSLYEYNRYGVLFYLIYVDDNDVPELYMDSQDGATGDMMATYYGTVGYMMYIGPYGDCEYVERSGQFANSDGRMGYYTDTVYSVDKGSVAITSGGTWSEEVNPENPEEYVYEYSWNGETMDENAYYECKREAFAYDRSRRCNSTATAMTFDELISYLGGEAISDTSSERFASAYLEANTYYDYDLNNDGETEEIYYEIYTDFEDYWGCEILVYVNGECLIDKYGEYSLWGTVAICDFEAGDPFKEIYLEFKSESDCFDMGAAYRYNNGKFAEYFSVDNSEQTVGRWTLDLDMAGDGIVCFDQEYYTQFLGQGYAHRTFYVENGRLVQIPSYVYTVTDVWQEEEYHALISLLLMTDMETKTVCDTIEAGECFYVHQLYTETEQGTLSNDIRYIYVTTESGKCGWMEIPDEEFFEENSWRAWG